MSSPEHATALVRERREQRLGRFITIEHALTAAPEADKYRGAGRGARRWDATAGAAAAGAALTTRIIYVLDVHATLGRRIACAA